MNLLREYIKELLTEAAKGPQDLPAGVFVKIEPDPHGVTIFYATENGRPTKTGSGIEGEILLETLPPDEPLGPCGGAWMIGSAEASTGWGPMLYDVAMEYATMNGGGLVADRGSVSPAARKVWDYYMNNRGDVTGIQMDDLKNTLTPEEEDNCQQNVASIGPPTKNSLLATKTDWIKSPLSKRWTKPPTTIGALKAASKLIWQEWVVGRANDSDAEGMTMVESYIRGLLLEQTGGFLYRSSPEAFVQNLLRDGSIRSQGQDFVSISLDPASGGKDNYGEVTMKLDREKIMAGGGVEVVYDDPDFWNQFPDVAKHVTGYAGEDDYIDRGGDEEWGMDFADMAMDFEEEQEIVISELPLDAVVSVSSTVPLSQETLDLLSQNGILVSS